MPLAGKPAAADAALAAVAGEVHQALGELEHTLVAGDGLVCLDDAGDLVFSPLTAGDIPAEAVMLKTELTEMLPCAPVVSLLIEPGQRTGSLACFTHAGGNAARSSEPPPLGELIAANPFWCYPRPPWPRKALPAFASGQPRALPRATWPSSPEPVSAPPSPSPPGSSGPSSPAGTVPAWCCSSTASHPGRGVEGLDLDRNRSGLRGAADARTVRRPGIGGGGLHG